MALNESSSLRQYPRSTASRTIASPNGCSEPFSALAAYLSNSSSGKPIVTMSVTLGFPSVIVPVLSNTIVVNLCVVSNASPPLIKIPCSAPFPVPTIIAVGVAKPKAHGQAMTKTEMKIDNAKTPLSPANNHEIDDMNAKVITIGTK